MAKQTDYRALLEDVGAGDSGAAGANRLYEAIRSYRRTPRNAADAIYSSAAVAKWEEDANKIAALIGAVKNLTAESFKALQELRGWQRVPIDAATDGMQAREMYRIPTKYVAGDNKVAAGGLTTGVTVSKTMAMALIKVFAALEQDKLPVNGVISSGYRTMAKQIEEQGTAAVAGGANTSLHRFGNAIDVTEAWYANEKVVQVLWDKARLRPLADEGLRKKDPFHFSFDGH